MIVLCHGREKQNIDVTRLNSSINIIFVFFLWNFWVTREDVDPLLIVRDGGGSGSSLPTPTTRSGPISAGQEIPIWQATL